MPKDTRKYIAFVLLSLIFQAHLGVQEARAQENLESQGSPPSRLSVPSQVPKSLEKGAIKPDAFYLVDAQGNFVFVPRLAYEEYEKFLRDRDRLDANKIPEYVFESLQGTVQLRDDLAEIQWKASISLTNPNAEIVRVPLMMVNQNLMSKPQTSGGRLSFLRVSDQKGLEWWIQQDGSDRYEISFTTIQKLTTLGRQTSFRLELPDAPSELHIRLDGADQQVQVVGPSIPAIETTSSENRTDSMVRLSGGAHVISWRPSNDDRALDAIEVESVSRYSLSSTSQTWSGTTRMIVRPIGKNGPREFQIRLPEGMHWISRDTSTTEQRATIERISAPEKSELEQIAGIEHEWLLVRIREFDTDLPVDVIIPWDWSFEEKENGQVRFRALEIAGVSKHEGRLEIETPVGNDLWWKNSPWLQFLSQDRTTDGSGLLRYTFRFLQQSAILDGTLNREESTLRIRPHYLYRLEANQIRMDALIELPRLARNILDPRIMMPGWRIERIERNGAAMDYREEDSGEVVLASLSDDTSTSDTSPDASSVVTIRMTASREWKPDTSTRMDLVLPSFSIFDPAGTNRIVDHGNGSIAILFANNWKPKPDSQVLEGLIAESRLSLAIEGLIKEVAPSLRPQEDDFLSYRFQEGSSTVVWSGEWQKLERKISISHEFDLTVHDEYCSLKQQYKLNIVNEPLRRLPLILSKRLINSLRFGEKSVRILLDGVEVEWTQLPDTSTSDLLPSDLRPEEWSVVELNRPEFSGALEITVESRLPHFATSTESEVEFSMPLALIPIHDNSGNLPLGNRYRFHASRGFRCVVDDAFRKRLEANRSDSFEILLPDGAVQIPFRIQRLTVVGVSDVELSKVWLQSAFNAQQRRDRLVMQFRTDLRSIQFDLPDSMRTSPYELILDGKRIDGRTQGESSELSIELGTNAPEHSYVLEVWNWTSRSKNHASTIEAQIPRLRGASNTPSVLWQVILPTNEVLLWSGSNLFPESRWTWKSFGFLRDDHWSQLACEEWIGATRQDAFGSQGNTYVTSCIGLSIPLLATSIPRTYLWLPLGLLAIAFAGAGTRLGWLNRPWVWMAMALAIAFVVPMATDLAIVLGEGLLLGAVLALSFHVSSWLMDRRLQKRSVFASRSPKPSFSGSLSNRVLPEKDVQDEEALDASTAVRTEAGP